MSQYRTALVMHEACGRHDTGWAHPEHQGRLPAILQAVYEQTPALLDHVQQVEAALVTEEDMLRVHSSAHASSGCAGPRDCARKQLDRRTRCGNAGLTGIVGSRAGQCRLCSERSALVLEGEVPSAFALSRPPGASRHTKTSRWGFCLLNNVAIAARWLHTQGVERVLIVDWDVHHGNGTQDIFYADPSTSITCRCTSTRCIRARVIRRSAVPGAALNTNRNVQVRGRSGW